MVCMRAGIAVDCNTETISIDEMHFIKESWITPQWMCQKKAIYVVDRAFIKMSYWDQSKANYGATVISRIKSNIKL